MRPRKPPKGGTTSDVRYQIPVSKSLTALPIRGENLWITTSVFVASTQSTDVDVHRTFLLQRWGKRSFADLDRA